MSELSAHDWNSEVKSALSCLKLMLLSNERRCKFSPSSGSLLSQSMQERGKMSPSNRKVRLQLSVYGTFWRKKMRSSWVFQFIFFSVRERSVFYKSCYLIGSDSGQYSPHPAHSQRAGGSFRNHLLGLEKNKNVIYFPRSVRIAKNCALCLVYRPRPTASGGIQDVGHSFSQYGPSVWWITYISFHF